ncbi:hypothetical protein LTR97_009375 [Elasticomyces elasticus]|uniref:Inositol polyphosphate-related phosphatase domain-containing protein n=1 Tax=Elasticomyces elasticus TaxID=574655 RepID=A0AAN7ZXP4_9PEZI|nr:hypothetical protein LTR97_009375 [Elasticomyces elasticus]
MANDDVLDNAPIKPVSSLRSRFENLGKEAEPKPPSPAGSRQVSLTAPQNGGNERPRTASGEPGTVPPPIGTPSNGMLQAGLRKRMPSPPRTRPQSMMEVTPSQRLPPMVTVDSPQSPADHSIAGRLGTPLQPSSSSSRAGSPTRSHARTLSRATTPALEARMSMFLQHDDPPKLDLASKPKLASSSPDPHSVKVPPPVNRTAKPSVPAKPPVLAQKPGNLDLPRPSMAEITEHSASPFSTPPGSDSVSPDRNRYSPPQRERNTSDASFVERLRSDSGASSVIHRMRGESDASFAERRRASSNASFVEPSSLGESSGFASPPARQVTNKVEHPRNGLARAPTMPARYRHGRQNSAGGEVMEDRPRLPTRPDLQIRPGRTSPTKPRSGRTSPSKLSQQITRQRSVDGFKRASTFSEQPTPARIPAVKPPPQRSALLAGFDRNSPVVTSKIAPAIPAPRRSMDTRRPHMAPPLQFDGHVQSHDDVEEASPAELAGLPVPSASDYPDSSQTNRRPPRYKQRPYQIPTDYDTRLCAVCGEFVVTSGYITKAWNIRTGELLLNMVHHENVKATSLVFKPAAITEDEGKRLWIGTNIGEIYEVDIPSQQLVKTKAAHPRREITRMFRHASEMWTLDDSGELHVWKPDHGGLPSLDSQFASFRVPRGHSYAIAVGKNLWVANGKEIRVFNPGGKNDTEFQVLRASLVQPGTGDVTSGAILSSSPDLVYFGHSDGKVSIYDRNDFSCQGVLSISLYKISSLVGVGDYLWAGYNTGMVYVYDTSTAPWRVRKDWEAHEKKQVCSIVADPSAVWKMDRLQVITLGTDNMLRIWDGLLEEDWLESRMQEHDSEYCSFREITAAVLTWNAGASKPSYLQQSRDDDNFLREYMTSGRPPDIFVFGFQELVDLEDKKVTAKSFFKSKKKDSGEQEHMSHQYRAWRDHLTRCIEEYMPSSHSYTLLHTASMVGLFTCIFVKASERSRIKHVHTAEVKRGMGGLHGNKGALVLRIVLDDSSLCFVNCHLAAGQTQTIHRNNDVAAILEAEVLPPHPLSNGSVAQHSDVFASGGDGSMILDHEICILNGDLNYRIDTMGRDTVIKHVQQGNLSRLLERDQLLLSRKKNPGFRLRAFQENPIMFAPTYKYNLHSDDYDNSEKRRAPAWCDRILYRGLGKVKLEEYKRWEVRVSDHRPVSGRLRCRVKTVDSGLRAQVVDVVKDEFDAVRARVGRAVQVGWLTDVVGLPLKEAERVAQ